MNGTQILITVAYGVLVLLSIGIFAVIFGSTRPSRRAPVDEERLAHGEGRWGLIVVVLLVTLLAITIWQVPYGLSRLRHGGQRVDVVAQQFAFGLQPSTVRAGHPVEFHLRSRDVQHGFGLYQGTKLLTQVQVPARGESEQRLRYTFDKPGTYDILCLEFCGAKHHTMRATLTVK